MFLYIPIDNCFCVQESVVGHFAVAPNKPLVKKDFVIDQLSVDEVIVEVAGRGPCHTDISFLSGQVASKAAVPPGVGT